MATEPIDLEVAGTCTDAAGSAIGMPQLCDAWFGNQIFWLLVTLVVIYFILSRVALPRIAAILAERQGTITNDIAAAEDLKAKALVEGLLGAAGSSRATAQEVPAPRQQM